MAVHIETGTMISPTRLDSKRLEHLGLVAGMYDELGFGKLLDKLIIQDEEQRIVSVGKAVKAMVLNGLGFANHALYLTPLFFQDKPVQRLIGPDIEATHLNEHTLGRALDNIFDYDPTWLYSQLAVQCVQRLGLLCDFGHLDSTSFLTFGQYNNNDDDIQDQDRVIQITQGYSRDHRPDLNQVVLQLISEGQTGIPLLMEPLSGNNSDKSSFRHTVKNHIKQLQNDVGLKYIVADSALFTADTLPEMKDYWWISRVPETLGLANEIIDCVASDLMLELDLPMSRSLGTVYGSVNQRWVVVYSPQAYHRAQKTVDKHCLKQSSVELSKFNKLCKREFSCEKDAHESLASFESNLKITNLASKQILKLPRFKKKGHPVKGREPDFYVYRIEGALASMPSERIRQLEHKSCFILATNQLDDNVLSDEELITAYKNQQKVERGFRFLKDPMFMASTLYLKSPKRIMALMMVMTLCLLVYAALEYRIRKVLKTHNETFPNQKGSLIANPTTRWVFQFFTGIHVFIIGQMHEFVLNLNEYHIILLKLLGKRYELLYSESG